MSRARVSGRRAGIGGLLALLLAGCLLAAPSGSTAAGAEPGPDPRVKKIFTIHDDRITESSGLAASTVHSGILYTINDSDNGARIYAVNRKGDVVASLVMRLVYNRDWEAVAAGPRDRIWVGDIGDNQENQTSVTLYRFREPDTLHDMRLYWSRFRLRYEDGPHNAEALLVHPKTGQAYIVTKESGGAGIYEAPDPLPDDGTATLHRVSDAPTRVTGGAFLPDGSGVVLRNYTRAYVLDWPSGEVRRTIDLPVQRQGESLAVSEGGKRIFVGSEGKDSTVLAVPLSPPKSPPPGSTPTSSPSTATPEPTPSVVTSPGILVPGGSDPDALIAGLPWWVPAIALAVAVVAGLVAFPRRFTRSR